MARLARLVVPGQAHLVQWRSLSQVPAFVDAADQLAFIEALRHALADHRLTLHAYALRRQAMALLLRPSLPLQLSRFVQAIGRRYVRAYNQRHGRNGTLWSGRFRCCVVEPGSTTLWALRYVDQSHEADCLTSASLRASNASAPPGLLVTQPAEYWALGNTPFERESGYRALLDEALAPGPLATLDKALSGGWAFGSPAFAAGLQAQSPRPARPRPRGRPRSAVEDPNDVSLISFRRKMDQS